MDDFKDLLKYNPETGKAYWLKHHKKSWVGKEICTKNSQGYLRVGLNGKRYYLHRVVWYIYYGEEPLHIDHINGDKSDNRLSNLRSVTNQQNMFNRTGHEDNTSGYKGVFKTCSGYFARVGYNNKPHYVGHYRTKEEAALAYNEKALELHGEFARLNEVRLG